MRGRDQRDIDKCVAGDTMNTERQIMKKTILLMIGLAGLAVAVFADLKATVAEADRLRLTTDAPATTDTIVISNRTENVRVSGVLVNNGPSDGWLSPTAGATTNGALVVKGGSFSVDRPLIDHRGRARLADNGVYYWWSTNTCRLVFIEMVGREQ